MCHPERLRKFRIKELHAFNTTPVVGLREGSWLEVTGAKIILKGSLTARLFQQNNNPEELEPETDLAYLGK